jgi:hypothetical protein
VGGATAEMASRRCSDGPEARALRRDAVSSAALAVLALACVAAALAFAGGGTNVLAQNGGEDLSMFRDSSVSFYDPGDTAADADILPREVLEDDGSRSDRADAMRAHARPNYSDAHWYKTGQGSDPHGDLQEKNRMHREHDMQEMEHQRELDRERQQAAGRQEAAREQAARRQARLRMQRAAAMRKYQLRRDARTSGDDTETQSRVGRPLSYKAMQQKLAMEDAKRQARIMKNAGLRGHKGAFTAQVRSGSGKAKAGPGTSYAYKHPFAADKLGMQNLVMAEFSQDESKMQATTAAIFGKHKDKSKWSHGGLLLSDVNQAPPRTLHQAMQARRERLRAKAKQQELSAEAQMRRREAAHAEEDKMIHNRPHAHAPRDAGRPRVARVELRCTIEMLEHGECSSKPHVGSHGDVRLAPATAAPAAAPAAFAAPARGRQTRAETQARDKMTQQDKDHYSEGERSSLSSNREKGGGGGGGGGEGGRGRLHARAVVSVPTAGSVVSGWMKDAVSLF